VITGRVPVGIAYCPRCCREVYLDSLDSEQVEISSELLPATQYRAAHRPGWHKEAHHWVAERIELRQVFAMELMA
jgi:Zn-finger nucleic acid-binding protein